MHKKDNAVLVAVSSNRHQMQHTQLDYLKSKLFMRGLDAINN
jgi:hypothetical protein